MIEVGQVKMKIHQKCMHALRDCVVIWLYIENAFLYERDRVEFKIFIQPSIGKNQFEKLTLQP